MKNRKKMLTTPFQTPAKDIFMQTAMQNKELYFHYLNEFRELCVSSFQYRNMPDSIDVMYLESVLMERGSCILYRDDVTGFILSLPFLPTNNFTIYNEPYGRMAYGANGYTYDGLDTTNSVIIYNNMIKSPSLYDITMFANLLWFYESIVKMNALCQAHPFILQARDESTKISLLNIWKDLTGLAPVLRVRDNIMEDVKLLDLKSEFNADRVHDIKNKVYAEALESLGVRSANTDKKERLITGEVDSGNAASDALYQSRLMSRSLRFKKFNKMFGENVEVLDRYGNVYNDTQTSLRINDRNNVTDNTGKSGNAD